MLCDACVQDDPALPHCVWTVAGAALGRTEVSDYVLPVMGLELADPALNTSGHDCSSGASEAPPMATVAAVNDAAHSSEGTISLLLGALDDARVQTHGIRDPSSGEFTCVCLTMGLGDDVSIQFVATKVQQLCSEHLCCAEQVSWEEMQYVGPITAKCTECLHVYLALEDLEHTHLSHGELAQPDLHIAVRRGHGRSVMQALPA